jgi:hypothetical protein
MIKGIIKYLLPNTLFVGISGVLVGTSCALLVGKIEWIPAILCLLFTIAAQISGNLTHSHYEITNNHKQHSNANFSNDATHSLTTVLKQLAFGSKILAATIGLALLTIGGWICCVPVVLVIAIILFNERRHSSVLKQKYGIPIAIVYLGIIPVLTTALIQVCYDTHNPFIWYYFESAIVLAIITGLMAVNVILSYHLRNLKSTYNNIISVSTITFIIAVLASIELKFGGNPYLLLAPITIYYILSLIINRKALTATKTPSVWIKYNIYNMFGFAILILIAFTIYAAPDQSIKTIFGL